ncbi:tyrosine recombinase XerC [Metabacillus idriensis]|uniref:tyrosine recombinase XerC n=1 Tax=Metabacillus idriensis TaxID=324768 RepID=UPI002814914F|nr:tyrosine recombinase XerC [Metabacillus idriensis]MDR0137356.1 tyrosine recombinase XerC [Metabacillus idriensis]
MENVKNSLNLFVEYLQIEKNYSQYTIVNYVADIEDFFIFMKEQSLIDLQLITYSDTRLYLTQLHQKNFARKTISRKISSLRSFYRFLNREKIASENPFASVSLPKKEHRLPQFLYEKELEQLFTLSDSATAAGQRNQALLEVLYGTGIRVSELCQIKLTDLDLQIGTVLVNGKGGKQRYVPFGSFAQDTLELYLSSGRKQLLLKDKQAGDHDHLFVNQRGGPLTVRGVRHILNEMIKKTSTTMNISPHMFRHTFATHLLNEGADMRSVQELLGHSHLSSTQIYTHVTKDHLRNIYMSHHPRA